MTPLDAMLASQFTRTVDAMLLGHRTRAAEDRNRETRRPRRPAMPLGAVIVRGFRAMRTWSGQYAAFF